MKFNKAFTIDCETSDNSDASLGDSVDECGHLATSHNSWVRWLTIGRLRDALNKSRRLNDLDVRLFRDAFFELHKRDEEQDPV